MKSLRFLWLGLILLGCADDESPVAREVDDYVAGLRSGKYENAMELPAFTVEAIPYLLAYRNDARTITQFPRNPLSSYAVLESTVGMYALWTIESVRESLAPSRSMPFPGRFPSLNPVLAQFEADGPRITEASVAQPVAATAYQAWWQQGQSLGVDELMKIDPLESVDYSWL